MSDIQINQDGYLVVTNGNLTLVTGVDAIAQHATMRLRTWLGETPYNQAAGVPYLTIIFEPGTPMQAVKFILEQTILGTPGVTGVSLEPLLNRETRVLTVTGTITALDVDIPFSIDISEEI